MLVVICGPACSGKDTIAAQLIEFPRIIQHTTRPKRPGEQEGVDYFYHNNKNEAHNPYCFKTFVVANNAEWHYWFEYEDIQHAIKSSEIVITITDGNNAIKLMDEGAKIILIRSSLESILKRYYKRESKKSNPDYKEAMRRILADIEDFSVFNKPEIALKINAFENLEGDIVYTINSVKSFINKLKSSSIPVNNKKEFNNTDGDCSLCICGAKCQLTAGSDDCLNVKQLKPNHTYCSEDICMKEECSEFNQKINMCGRKIKYVIPVMPIEKENQMDDVKKVICYDESGNETLNIDVPEIPAALAIGSTHIDFDEGLVVSEPVSDTDSTHDTDSQNESLKWEEFKDYMYHLHEMQDEGCRGCERPSTDCRECMQKYYWDNISYYLKYGLGG